MPELNWLLMRDILTSALDILIVAFLIFQVYKSLKGSQAIQIAKGLGVILLVFILSKLLRLQTLNWILTYLLNFGIIAIIILFQPEFRKLLIRFGEGKNIGFFSHEEREQVFTDLIESLTYMSKKRIGALIVIRRHNFLGGVIETGVKMDALLSSRLLISIFNKKSFLHDGAVIIYSNRIMAAACILPLSDNPNLDKDIGTRHRAALGISEESDALVLVVSESSGRISAAVDGKLHTIPSAQIRQKLEHFYTQEENHA
jgi:diadenylate cyclase